MNESVNGDANPATNHKGDGLKDTPNSSRGGCACWLLIVKPDKTGLIIKYRCPHLHRWPELPLNLSLWLYFTKCYCSAIMDAWRSVSFFFFFIFLFVPGFLDLTWFKDRLCNPNVTVTLRCQRAPLSSLFSLSFPVHTVQWTAPVAGQDVKESHVPDWNCMGNHPDWLVSCYPLVGVAQNCITVTSVEIACCKPNEQEGTVQSLTYLKAEITHAW